VQLGGILETDAHAGPVSKNVCVKEESQERVECAIRLPGPKDDAGQCMWLPIDSKFPTEDYARLQSAAEVGDPGAVQAATDALLRALRLAAKDIHDKYVNPPATTDYAIMFLATEGLYAEALRQPQFVEEMQQKYRVAIAGRRHSRDCEQFADGVSDAGGRAAGCRGVASFGSGEDGVWEVWRCAGSSAATITHGTRTIEETGTRTRVMERRLRAVEQMDPAESATILRCGGELGGSAERRCEQGP